MMLTMNNFIIETVSTWKDINNKIIDFQPNLILLDIRLDGADGRSICKNLHLNNETKKIPIILFSANPENSINLYEWLADDFIPKPFHFSGMRLHHRWNKGGYNWLMSRFSKNNFRGRCFILEGV